MTDPFRTRGFEQGMCHDATQTACCARGGAPTDQQGSSQRRDSG
jgi:hypothetical protein